MCKNGLGLFAQKWLLFLEIWWIKFLQNDKQHLLLKFFTKIFIFDWVIAIFMFFDKWWRHVLVHLKKYDHKIYCSLTKFTISENTLGMCSLSKMDTVESKKCEVDPLETADNQRSSMKYTEIPSHQGY